jgi:hypothetical protein
MVRFLHTSKKKITEKSRSSALETMMLDPHAHLCERTYIGNSVNVVLHGFLPPRMLALYGEIYISWMHFRITSLSMQLYMCSLLFGQVSSVEIERICNAADNNVLETAAVGVPPPGGGPEQLVIAVVFKDSESNKADLNQLRISFNSAVQKKLNPLFRVLIFALHTVALSVQI